MILKKLFKDIGCKEIIGGNLGRKVDFASSDSRILFSNSVFLARKGCNFNPLDSFSDFEDKVNCFVAENADREKVLGLSYKYPGKVFVLVEDLKKTGERLSRSLFKGLDSFKIIGITGTNGKTTVSALVSHILNYCGIPSGLTGTVNYKWGGASFRSFMTTPDNFLFKSLLYKMYKDGMKYAVSEISSHSLIQGRLSGLKLERAVFTNLSHDHLDYHKTFKNYFNAKYKIFNLLKPKGIGVISTDGRYGLDMYNRVHLKKISFGMKNNPDYKITAYRFERNKSEMLIRFRDRKYFIRSNLIGRFNLYNILAAFSLCRSLNISSQRIIEAIGCFKRPSGRMEEVVKSVFIDYAHTPAALKEALLSLRNVGYKKIILVFGCGGDRDKKKRPVMGRIASKYADYSIITSDNSRGEDPLKICRDVDRGMRGTNYSIVIDRKKAIEKALKSARPGTAVLIAGKGHENYQVLKDKTIPFSDRKVVRNCCLLQQFH